MILTELSSPEYYENCIEILIEFARSSQDLSPAILCNLIPFIISKKMEIEKAFSGLNLYFSFFLSFQIKITSFLDNR